MERVNAARFSDSLTIANPSVRYENQLMSRPLCFVLMPFGEKPDGMGGTVNFDAVYENIIRPAVTEAEMEIIRADEELEGGIIHKPMFERLILCEYAVADLTTANANVLYELGIRHAARPKSTALVFAKGFRLPFDVAPLRGIPYQLSAGGIPSQVSGTRRLIKERLLEARNQNKDSPIYELIEDYPDVDHTKTDVFRERVNYSIGIKAQLQEARNKDSKALHAIEETLDPLEGQEIGVAIDLLLSYRAVRSWSDMIRLVEKMPSPLSESILVKEQFAFALNRNGDKKQAENLLLDLIKNRGPSSETYGILGRVYKDQWKDATEKERHTVAQGFLRKSIEAYLKGFETDWRDAYPGINAVTLMEVTEPKDTRQHEIIPVVSYAVKRRIESGEPDYWDYATLLELSILANNEDSANKTLADTLAHIRESWEPETTADNLSFIRTAREQRGEDATWILAIEQELKSSA
jgi:hypothetical protein